MLNEKKEENTPNSQGQEFDPWGAKLFGAEDYQRLCTEFGIKPVDQTDIPASIYEKFRALRRKVIFGHRDFELIIKAIQDNKPWAVMSGIKPSGKFHMGNMLTAIEMIELQKLGGFVYYAIADIESMEDNETSLEESYKNAVDNMADMLALGLDPKRCYVWLQSKEDLVNKMPFRAGPHVTNAMLKAIYGDKLFGLYLAALVQVGDILLPQLKDDVMPTVVPVGIDQDPHIRLTRDLSRHFKKDGKELFKPGATYHKLLPGLDDITQKMSKSRPDSYFYFEDDPKSIKHKIMNAFTGGQGNKEDQMKLGGNPEKCMIYMIMQFLFEDDDAKLQDRYIRCRGGLLCGTCKKEVLDKVLSFVKAHNEKKGAFRPIAEKLLTQK